MKTYLPLLILLAAGAFAITLIQHHPVDTQASPQALLTAAADAQHEITRVPARFDRMSDDDEIAIGQRMAQRAANFNGSPVDAQQAAATQAYLQAVGLRVAAHTRRKLPWTFHYIPDPDFENAFALPGGHIFVGEGLLRRMASEDALAGVLGHEIEHVDLRHCAERAQSEAHLRQLGPLAGLAGLPIELFMAGYSKEQELEADRDGATLAVAAGYSYTGILQLFDTMGHAQQSDIRPSSRDSGPAAEAAHLTLATLSGYFATHPPFRQRADQLRDQAERQRWPTHPLHPLEPRLNTQ